jgi:DNA adenine methylase
VESSEASTKPFLKWAGGKGQLLKDMDERFPVELKQGKIHTYIEPFLGGGAPFFFIIQNYQVERFFISDINRDLILIYQTIQKDVSGLLESLGHMQSKYFKLKSDSQKIFFYKIRSQFNAERQRIDYSKFSKHWIQRSSQAIFLNKTCFNGLFRFNSKYEFNTAFGQYSNPKICDESNLLNVAKLLKKSKINQGDYSCCERLTDSKTFVYLDPPYKPISKTANFTAYSPHSFNDQNQYRLALFYRHLDQVGAKLMLSNSDSSDGETKYNLIEDLYQGYQIDKVKARRAINRDATKRSAITELLITNY